jgi:hypothetical protein
MQQVEFILNLVFFLVGVVACIIGTMLKIEWIGPAYVMIFSLVYLLASKPTNQQIKLTLCILIIGYTINALLELFRVVTFAHMTLMIGQLPLWLVSLWIMFAALFQRMFQQLTNLWTAGIIGLSCGPAIYLLAKHFTMLQLPLGVTSIIILSIIWAIMLPTFLRLHGLIYKTIQK